MLSLYTDFRIVVVAEDPDDAKHIAMKSGFFVNGEWVFSIFQSEVYTMYCDYRSVCRNFPTKSISRKVDNGMRLWTATPEQWCTLGRGYLGEY